MWKTEKERLGEIRGLFGQDQLVLAGYPQQVALAGMLDFERVMAAQQLLAFDAWPAVVGWCREGRLLDLGIGCHGVNANKN